MEQYHGGGIWPPFLLDQVTGRWTGALSCPGGLPARGQARGKQCDEWSSREMYDKSAAHTAQKRDLLSQHERAKFDFT